MRALLPLALLLIGAGPADRPRTYLLSVVNVPLSQGESIQAFSVETWGVHFRSVCRIPPGWRITAGGSATPDGTIHGEGSHGVTWFRSGNPPELRAFVLVTLYGPVRRERVGTSDSFTPPTFQGTAAVGTVDFDGDSSAQRPLTYRNITLTPALRCPAARP